MSEIPAFPTITAHEDQQGMTLRDYAVIKFMAADIDHNGLEGYDPEIRVKMAYENADALLKERERKDENNG